jgi:predicted nucleic acid-binding protein
VSVRRRDSHVVLDTDVISWLLDRRPLPQADEAWRVVAGRQRVVSFVTVTELRYGAQLAGWGELRTRRLEKSLTDVDIVHTTETLVSRCADLRTQAARIGHGLAHKIHEADRWVASTALALGLELIAGDTIFGEFPGLDVHRIEPT